MYIYILLIYGVKSIYTLTVQLNFKLKRATSKARGREIQVMFESLEFRVRVACCVGRAVSKLISQ